jgi:HEAT repeat protein
MRFGSWRAPAVLMVASLLAIQGARAQTRPSPIDEFVGWLDDPSRQWLATAELQRFPDAAIPHLLDPARAVFGPHRSLTPALLTLAKIGEPALPAIADRVRAIRRKDSRYASQAAEPLIHVLGLIGPAAVPSLIEIVELRDDRVSMYSLGYIVEMEQRSRHYGQVLSPWSYWRAADDRLARLERAVVPLLPRIERIMDRALERVDPDSPSSVRPAAYLLARCGGSSENARGLQVLENLARSAKPFYNSIDVIRQLYVLKAPATASLIRLTAPRVPPDNDLKAAYLLSMAVALQQLGERDYGPLVDEAIRTGRPADRINAATFLGQTEDLANVPRLIALLDDRTPWSGHVVGDEALDALRRLTLQDLPGDSGGWRAWLALHRDAQYETVLEEWLTAARRSMGSVPIWTANTWIAKLRWTSDPRVLPLVADYLRRSDLAASATGSNSRSGGGGDGPHGNRAPAAVSLLLGLAQQGANGAVDALEECLRAADPEVRWFGAMALAAYRPRQAVEHLAAELQSTERWRRSKIAELLLMLGDARGIPARIDAMELGSGMYGEGMMRDGDTTNALATESSRGIRMFACRDLRTYTQQPLPCDPNAAGDALRIQVDAWRRWWNRSRAGLALRMRQARLDLDVQYQIRSVTIDSNVAR